MNDKNIDTRLLRCFEALMDERTHREAPRRWFRQMLTGVAKSL